MIESFQHKIIGTHPSPEFKKRSNALLLGDSPPNQSSKLANALLIGVIFSSLLFSYLPGGNLINKLISGLSICIFILLWLQGNRRIYKSTEVVLLLSWTTYTLLPGMFSLDPLQVIIKTFTIYQLAILVVFASSVMIWSGDVRFFIWGFVIASLGSYLVSFTPLSGVMFGNRVLGSVMGRTVGTLRNANSFGIMMVETQFLLAYLWSTSNKIREKMWIVAIFSTLTAAVVQSGSRTALIGLVFLVFILIWAFSLYKSILSLKKFSFFLVWISIIFGIVIYVGQQNPEIWRRYETMTDIAFSGELSKEGSSHSIRGRAALATIAWDLTSRYPFGVGLNNFKQFANTYSHSNYMEILVTTGFLGLLLYYAIYLGLFIRAIKVPVHAAGAIAARRLLIAFPFLLGLMDIANVSYYSKDLWLLVGIVIAIIELAKLRDYPEINNPNQLLRR